MRQNMIDGDADAWRAYYRSQQQLGFANSSMHVLDLTDLGLDSAYSIWGLFYFAAMSVGTVAFHLPFLHTMCCHALELMIYIIFCAVAYPRVADVDPWSLVYRYIAAIFLMLIWSLCSHSAESTLRHLFTELQMVSAELSEYRADYQQKEKEKRDKEEEESTLWSGGVGGGRERTGSSRNAWNDDIRMI
jgi:hypothetical protein